MNNSRKRVWFSIRQVLAVILISAAIGTIDFLTRGAPVAHADVPPAPDDGSAGGSGGCGTPAGEGGCGDGSGGCSGDGSCCCGAF